MKMKQKPNMELRRAFIFCRKIRKIENENNFYFFYGDDLSNRFYVGTLKDCRREKKQLLKMKTNLLSKLEFNGEKIKMSILGSDHYYRKRFMIAHLLGRFLLDEKFKNGTLYIDDKFRAYFKRNHCSC